MDDVNKKEYYNKKSVLWLIFRKEAEETRLPTRVIERIKFQIKEKFSEK